MTFEKACELLKNCVKESHIAGQKHLDLTLIDASERADYQKALMICQAKVSRQEIAQEDLNTLLGLNA